MTGLLFTTLKMLLAIVLGGVIGMERETLGKPAGTRTYALVALGSTLFTILANNAIGQAAMAGQIIVGIGFIGAGLIVFHKQHIEGLTTAAGLWATAAVGMAIGLAWYSEAAVATLFIFLLLYVVRKIESARNKKRTLWDLFEKK